MAAAHKKKLKLPLATRSCCAQKKIKILHIRVSIITSTVNRLWFTSPLSRSTLLLTVSFSTAAAIRFESGPSFADWGRGKCEGKEKKENGENDDNDDGSMTTAQHVTHSLSCTRTNCRPGSYQSYLNNERAMLSASLCKQSERCCVQKKRKKIPRKSYIHFPSVSLLCSDISRRVSFHHHQIPIHSHTLDASQRRRHRYTLSSALWWRKNSL